MQEIENNSNKDLEKIDQDINFHRIIIFLIIIAVVFFYLIMKDIDIKEEAQHWGPVGDFFGGILNPIFALFAFYWLTYSVRLQIKELKETREELKKAAAAQAESAIHQKSIAELEKENVITQKELLALQEKTLLSQQMANKAQQEQIEMQNFERLFFELIKTKNDALNMIRVNDRTYTSEINLDGISVFISRLKALKKSDNPYLYYKTYMNDLFSSYLGVTNQILKLLNESKSNIANVWSYIYIFQATLSKVELEVIFFSGLLNAQLKRNIEQTHLLSVLDSNFELSIAQRNLLTRNAFFYKKYAFGINKDWDTYFEEYEKCDFKNVDIDSLIEKITFLENYFVLFLFNNDSDFFLMAKEDMQEKLAEELKELECKLKISDKNEADLKFEQVFDISDGKDLNDYEKLKNITITDELYFLLKYRCNIDTLNKVKANLN